MGAHGQAPQKPGIGTRYGQDGVLVRQINAQVPSPGPGMLHSTLPSGTWLQGDGRGRGRSAPHVWFAMALSIEEQLRARIVVPGLVNGSYPRLVGSGLIGNGSNGEHRINHDPFPTIALSGSGEEHLYIRIYVRHYAVKGYRYATDILSDVEATGSFGLGWTPDDGPAIYIARADEVPESQMLEDTATWDLEDPEADVTGTIDAYHNLELCQFNNGLRQEQPLRNSISVHWCDDATPGEEEEQDPVRVTMTTASAG